MGRSPISGSPLCSRHTLATRRNHSFLHGTGTLKLAPVYDAAPTAQFVGTRDLALWVGGQAMDHDKAAEVVDSTLARIAAAVSKAAQATPEVSRSVVEACEGQVERLLRQR